jgi:hypothetical protein
MDGTRRSIHPLVSYVVLVDNRARVAVSDVDGEIEDAIGQKTTLSSDNATAQNLISWAYSIGPSSNMFCLRFEAPDRYGE